jgi:disease resistance protein RPM1
VGIGDELESIKCFLKDVDARAEKEGDLHEGMKAWVKQVREAAFHIEDVIDEYTLHVPQHDSNVISVALLLSSTKLAAC